MDTNVRRWALAVMMLAFGALASLGVAATPQEQVGLRLEVDKRQVSVGDTLTVKIEFRRMGAGQGYSMGEPAIQTLENFDVRGSSISTSVMMVNGQMSQVSTKNIRLEATKPGEVTLGPAIVLDDDGQQGRREIKSNTVLVTVTPRGAFSLFKKKKATPPPSASAAPSASASAASPDELRDIRGLMPAPGFPWGWLLGLLAVGALAFWAYRRWKGKAAGGTAERTKGPAETLRERYRALSRSEGTGEEFCRAASALARSCLQYRYEFAAEDSTTSEVMAELKRRKVSEAVKDSVERCLKTCDRVLYAEGNLSAAARESTLQAVSNLLPKA